jgi:hypothetical protein
MAEMVSAAGPVAAVGDGDGLVDGAVGEVDGVGAGVELAGPGLGEGS